MAEPSNFDWSNAAYGPPEGMTEEQVQTIFAYHGVDRAYDCKRVVSCWKLTKEELEEVNRTGRIWLNCLGGLPPHFITGHEEQVRHDH